MTHFIRETRDYRLSRPVALSRLGVYMYLFSQWKPNSQMLLMTSWIFLKITYLFILLIRYHRMPLYTHIWFLIWSMKWKFRHVFICCNLYTSLNKKLFWFAVICIWLGYRKILDATKIVMMETLRYTQIKPFNLDAMEHWLIAKQKVETI